MLAESLLSRTLSLWCCLELVCQDNIAVQEIAEAAVLLYSTTISMKILTRATPSRDLPIGTCASVKMRL
jgi:hypothetical protein